MILGHTLRNGLLAGLIGLCLCACVSRRETIAANGWAYPLPPLSRRSPEFLSSLREAGDLERLRAAVPWATEVAVGRGSSPRPTDVSTPLTAELLARVQAREAARRHLAERIASLPVPRRAASTGPPPRLGDPGILAYEATIQINDRITSAPVRSESISPEGVVTVEVALRLDNVARLALGESPVSMATAPEQRAVPSAPGRTARPGESMRTTLPQPSRREMLALARQEQPSPDTRTVIENDTASPVAWPTPEARAEAQRRAERMARQSLARALGRKPYGESRQPLGLMMESAPPTKRIVLSHVETAPVVSVVWDDIGRCRVRVAIDWTRLSREIEREEMALQKRLTGNSMRTKGRN